MPKSNILLDWQKCKTIHSEQSKSARAFENSFLIYESQTFPISSAPVPAMRSRFYLFLKWRLNYLSFKTDNSIKCFRVNQKWMVIVDWRLFANPNFQVVAVGNQEIASLRIATGWALLEVNRRSNAQKRTRRMIHEILQRKRKHIPSPPILRSPYFRNQKEVIKKLKTNVPHDCRIRKCYFNQQMLFWWLKNLAGCCVLVRTILFFLSPA